jgi:four helix bundle protein
MTGLGIHNLITWQLANDYKKAVYALAARPPACLDRSYADHLRRTAASVELNIVEGYHRRTPRDFARFLTIARASLAEADAQLHDGIDRGHFQPLDLATTNALARRLVPAIMALRRSLLARAAP